ncbi:MAG: PEP/pyruvate-binding domain-containing protein [bacterium]
MKFLANNFKDARPEEIGTKARNLFRLKKHFLVPGFVVVTTDSFRDYRKHGKVSPELDKELRKILRSILIKGPVAVRSSCTAEDMPGISFAGMYTTSLNIEDVDSGIEAIIRTWNSVDNERVRKYREHMDLPSGDMAVIIQKQLEPDVSGVMVTQSPFSVSEILIECCSGLGEKLVSGKITPTRYRVNLEGKIECKGENILSQVQAIELVRIGKKIEQLFKAPQDIEWAIAAGKIYILQSRPVMVFAAKPRRKGKVWCNANVRETIPDPMSPMGWSIFDKIFFPYIVMNVFGLPVNKKKYEEFRPVELISGRLYWNVNNTIAYGKSIGPILDFMEGDKSLDPQMAQAFRAVDLKNIQNPIPPLSMFWFSTIALVRLSYYIALSFCRFRWMSIRVKKAHDALNDIIIELEISNDMRTGVKNTREWMRYITEKFARRYFGGLFLSILSLILVSKLLAVKMGKEGAIIARKAIIGIFDKTGEMALALRQLANLAHQKKAKLTLTKLKSLYKNDKQFRNSFEQFIKDFGHRGPAEFDIASINWREDEDLVFRMILTAKNIRAAQIDRKSFIKALLDNMKAYERFVLKFFLPRLEAFMPLRENGKDPYLRVMAKIKDQLFVIENILIKRGYIKKHRDIFLLTLHDIDDILVKRATKAEIMTIVKKRKSEWEMYKHAKVPDIIFESGERIFAPAETSSVLSGEPLSFGKVRARARVVNDFSDSVRLKPGEILVTNHTDPGWTPLFTIAAGIVIEVGGVICHAAMVARELGVPAVVIRNAISLIPDGSLIELDADEGIVKIITGLPDSPGLTRGQASRAMTGRGIGQ